MTDPVTIETFGDVGAGAILGGKYRVVRVLGRGGMGVVVEAVHVRLGEHVAIKFLASEAHDNKETRERFEREARATVRMRSPHVARVRDIGELAAGQPYIVMELLVGSDLGKVLESETLPPPTIVDLMLQALEALAEAHALGIVHRDIKPANLFVTRTIDSSLHLKLLDFGVATGARGDIQLTNTGLVVGTPAYMCPEQMRSGREARPTWDLWALGVVMFEAFERAHPFAGESFAELAVSVLTAEPRAMSATPEGLRPIIARCLAKDPSQRFADAAELATALAPFASIAQAASSTGRTARALGRAPSAPISPGPRVDPTPNPSPRVDPMPSPSPSSRVDPTPSPNPSLPTSILQSPPVIATREFAESPIPREPPRRSRALIAIATAILLLAAIAGALIVTRVGTSPSTSPAPDAAVITPRAVDAIAVPIDAPIDALVDAPIDVSVDAPIVAPIDAAVHRDAGGARPPKRDAAPSVTRPIDAGVTPPDDALSAETLMQGRH